MSPDVVFMMGEYAATFPNDRQFAKNHMWAQLSRTSGSEGSTNEPVKVRLGLSAYAVRLLQDVYFLDLIVEPGMSLTARQEIGSIESKKAESSLYSPLAGIVTEVNHRLLQDPTAINLDKYGTAWLFEMSPAPGAIESLLTTPQYLEHLTVAWEVAQRTIKGQANA